MYITLRSFETGLRETFGLIARPLSCGPDLHRTLTYFFLGKTHEKGDPCLLSDFTSFLSNYVGLPIFQNFRHDFFSRFSINLTHVSGSFLGVEMRPMFTDFLCVKSTHLGGTSPYYSLHMWSYSPSSPHPDPLKGHPNNFANLSIYGMHRYENFATKLWESVGKGHLYERIISAGTLEWRGTLRVPPQPGCPRVCPPWAHRSYATVARYYGGWFEPLTTSCADLLTLSNSFDFPMYGNEQMVIVTLHLHTSIAQFGSILSWIRILTSSIQ